MDLLLHDETALKLDRPAIMGILNLTPDSFHDGGRYTDLKQAVDHGLTMARQGAQIIDVGGESTRPGARRIGSEEQIARVVPVIRSLRQRLDEANPRVQISIDTTLSTVARAAADAGANILNDVSAGREDAGMLVFAAQKGLPMVLMHMKGKPGTMQNQPMYDDVVTEVRDFLLKRARAALDAGIGRQRIILDPGIGFGKTTEHNLALLRSLNAFVGLGYPLLVGASRKRFIGEFGVAQADQAADPRQRLGGTCAVTAHCVLAGVRVLRVHDVEPNRQAADLAWALSAPVKRKNS
jgi:dihydropteroate synthase